MAQQQKSGAGSRRVGDVMTANPQCVSERDSLIDAARIMKNQDTGVVPVVDGKKVIGLITDRDIVVRAIADGKDLSNVRVNDVMSRQVRSVKEDTSVDEVLNLMTTAEIRRVPVVNQSDEIVGIVSIGDLARTNRDDKVGQAVEKISEAPPNN
jgi:CBS domain-containing protein